LVVVLELNSRPLLLLARQALYHLNHSANQRQDLSM
jgi:hypothetical protein